jgi:hypothetical protein
MTEGHQLATKDVESNAENSLQTRARSGSPTGFKLLSYLNTGSYRIAPWWSPQRDKNLEDFVRSSDHLSSAVGMLVSKVASVPVKVEPRDMRLKKHQRDAEDFTIRLNEESEFGQGWHTLVARFLQDWWCADNGAYIEIIGDGDPLGPIEGPAMGLAHLDSHRCQRTGDPEFPVLYQDASGARVKYHRSRVAFAADLPSAREEMYGVGFCAISRVINNAQILSDINNYKQEKLGSRPLRAILEGRGISTDAILDAIAVAEESMDSKGLGIFAQIPVLGDIAPDASLSLTSLVGLPDGYDEETTTRLAMFLIALGFGVPIRWLWPAATSGATKADAMYQHIAGLGGGVGHVLSILTLMLGGDARGSRHGIGKFLPSHLRLVFDFQDDEQDRSRAEIQGLRSRNRNTDLEKGVIDARTAREQALMADDITQAQFERLELADGRLPGGEPVLTLFHNTHEPFLSWLDLGVDNPLAITANDPMDMLDEINIAAIGVQDDLANTSVISRQEKAEQALAALDELKGLYAPLAQQSIQSSLLGQPGMPSQIGVGGGDAGGILGGEEETSEPEPLAAEPESEAETPGVAEAAGDEAEKAFNWGVGAGGVISGQLARGAGGRFVNAADMMASLQAAMLARLEGRGIDAVNSASALRELNRQKVAEALGVDVSTMGALAGMRSGATTPEAQQALVKQGYASVNPDGSISTNNAGAALLRAASSGDLDAAKQAKAKADTAISKGSGGGRSSGGGGGGSAKEPKPTKEEIMAENRAAVRENMGGRIGPEAFTALMQFADGNDLSPSQKRDLARLGMVEVDEDGFARLTSSGKTVIAAAGRGDVRGALDSLSRGAEAVAKVERRINDLRLQADSYQERAAEAYPEAERKAAKIQEDIQKAYQTADRSIERLNEQKQGSIERGKRHDEEARRLEAQADYYQNLMNDEDDPIQKEKLQIYSTRLREQAENSYSNVQKEIKNLVDLERSTQDIISTTEKRVGDLTERAANLLAQAEQNAGAWRLRAQQMLDEADTMEYGIGGGVSTPSGILNKALEGMRRWFGGKPVERKVAERVIPLGEPLPEWRPDTPVPITAEDIEEIALEWDADEALPAEAKGMLRARPATLSEMVTALRDKPPQD